MPYSKVVEDDVRGLLSDLDAELAAAAGSTVLITGAAGFLMSYIVDVLAAWNEANPSARFRVIALDNHTSGLPERLAHLQGVEGLRFVAHDVSKPFDPGEPVHWIIHGASIASPIVYRRFPLETLDANIGGTRLLLELSQANPIRGFVVMSTSEIYGDPDPAFIPTNEDYRGFVSCTGPRACYDEGKRVAETLAMTYFRLYQTPVKLIRPFNVYGPGLRLDDGRVLPDFMTQVLKDEPIELLSDGRPTRAFCYVSDATGLILRILFSSFAGEAFNVGNDEREISMLDLARETAAAGAKVLDRPAIGVTTAVSGDADYLVDNPQRRLADIGKARRSFPGWTPKIGLEDGLARTLQHHLERAAASGRGAQVSPAATVR
jgi:UDP-glucuronate decarboxylase